VKLRLLLVFVLSAVVLAQSALDGILVQMLNAKSEQWDVILTRNKAALNREEVVPAIRQAMQLAVKGRDKEAGDLLRAIDHADWFMTEKKEYRALGQLTLATYYIQQGVPAKAGPVVDWLIETHPDLSDAFILQGHLYMESDPNRAIAMFLKAAELTPTSEGAYLGLGQAYFLVTRKADAIKAYKKVLELNPDNPTAKDAIRYLQDPNAGKITAATAAAGQHFQRAEELFARGKYLEAIKEYDLAIKADVRFSKAWVYKGDAYLQLGQLERAITCYRQAIKFDGRDKQAYRFLGAALERKFAELSKDPKDLEEAISSYQKALELDPEYASAQQDLARALKLRDQK
jgi:superkiller protein 3